MEYRKKNTTPSMVSAIEALHRNSAMKPLHGNSAEKQSIVRGRVCPQPVEKFLQETDEIAIYGRSALQLRT